MSPEELYEGNEGLVFAVIQREFHGAIDDDTLQIGRMGLWRACLCWKEDRGTAFSTYAYISIKNAIIASHQKDFRKPELRSDVTMISIDKNIRTKDRTDEIDSVADMFLGKDDTGYRDFECKDLLRTKLNDRELKVVSRLSAGYKQTEIAKEMGMTRQNVSLIVIKIRKKLQKAGFFPECEL